MKNEIFIFYRDGIFKEFTGFIEIENYYSKQWIKKKIFSTNFILE